MAIGDDFEIQGDGDIRHVSGTTNYPGIEVHEWLQSLAAQDAASGDDFMDISTLTPSVKQFTTIITLNFPYNIDDAASQYIYDASIIQNNGDDIYDPVTVLAPAGMYLQIIQNGALATNFWDTGINPDANAGISHRFILKVRSAGADIDGRRLIGTSREWFKTYLEYKINGTVRGANVMAFTSWGDDLNNTTASATVDTWDTIVNTEGYANLDVNNDTTDEFYYSEWDRAGYTINQFIERMKFLTQRGTSETLYGLDGDLFRGITHEVAIDNPSATDFELVEPVSWATGTGQMLAIDDINAGTVMYIQLLTGIAPVEDQEITGTTSGATADADATITERAISTPFCGQSTGTSIVGAYGFCLEVLDLGSTDKVTAFDNLVYQPPNYVIYTMDEVVNTEDYILVTDRGYKFQYDNEASGPFTIGEIVTFDTPVGTAMVTKLIDKDPIGLMYIGPILSGSVPEDDSGITGASATADVDGEVTNDVNLRQFTLDGILDQAGTTSVLMTEDIPADTPATGTIRILRDSGYYSKHPYSGWDTKTFTITSHDFDSDNASDDNNAYISYLDILATGTSEDFTYIFDANRVVFNRVRDGGGTPIVTFETVATMGDAAVTVTAIRNSDA